MANTTRRNSLKNGTLAAGAAGAVAAPAAAQSEAPKKVVHYRDGRRPNRPPLFSRAVSLGNLLFISGIGAHVPGDIKVHTKIVLDEIQEALESCGSSMEKVLKCNVYLNSLDDYDGMNEVFRGRFGDEPGVRTTIAAAGGIPGNSLVEIDVIACI
jgi:enamine deaminase RidA (YjgF/YER057c/UK114 family)